jgi:hypothetical protein
LFGVLVDGGVTVVTMSFETTLKAEDDIGTRRNYCQKGIGVIVILFLSALAFYGFQSIARVEEYESGFGVLFGTQIKGKNQSMRIMVYAAVYWD